MATGKPFRETITDMADGHADGEDNVFFRAPQPMRAQALARLTDRGLDLRRYLIACLAALIEDPDGRIADVREHLPAEKRRGRPPRTDREQQP